MNWPASTPPAWLSVATTDVLASQSGMSLSTRITGIPASTAACRASCTLGLVGVMTIACTPCVTIDSMALISPSSSVALAPWANTRLTSGWSCAQALAESTMVS